MGKATRKWQDTEYVLGYFGKSVGQARKVYRAYVEQASHQGRRPELVGGGLIRSVGGWKALKELGKNKRIKGDERILGESEFVGKVLKEADEKYERRYDLKRKGISLQTVEEKVCELYAVAPDVIYSNNGVMGHPGILRLLRALDV